MSTLMIFQIALLIILTIKLSTSLVYLYFTFGLLSLIVVFFIASQRSNPAHKLIVIHSYIPCFRWNFICFIRSLGRIKIFEIN